MIKHGYIRSKYDSYVYYRTLSHGDVIYLLLYVDYMLIACIHKEETEKLQKELNTEFEMQDLGATTRILGMQIVRDRYAETLFLTQGEYIKKVLTGLQ